jgi:hypothetical protein
VITFFIGQIVQFKKLNLRRSRYSQLFPSPPFNHKSKQKLYLARCIHSKFSPQLYFLCRRPWRALLSLPKSSATLNQLLLLGVMSLRRHHHCLHTFGIIVFSEDRRHLRVSRLSHFIETAAVIAVQNVPLGQGK